MSKYSDMVDTLIRQQTAKLDAASDDARIKLREWELPEVYIALICIPYLNFLAAVYRSNAGFQYNV